MGGIIYFVYRDVNLLVSDRNKLAVKIYEKCERAKK